MGAKDKIRRLKKKREKALSGKIDADISRLTNKIEQVGNDAGIEPSAVELNSKNDDQSSENRNQSGSGGNKGSNLQFQGETSSGNEVEVRTDTITDPSTGKPTEIVIVGQSDDPTPTEDDSVEQVQQAAENEGNDQLAQNIQNFQNKTDNATFRPSDSDSDDGVKLTGTVKQDQNNQAGQRDQTQDQSQQQKNTQYNRQSIKEIPYASYVRPSDSDNSQEGALATFKSDAVRQLRESSQSTRNELDEAKSSDRNTASDLVGDVGGFLYSGANLLGQPVVQTAFEAAEAVRPGSSTEETSFNFGEIQYNPDKAYASGQQMEQSLEAAVEEPGDAVGGSAARAVFGYSSLASGDISKEDVKKYAAQQVKQAEKNPGDVGAGLVLAATTEGASKFLFNPTTSATNRLDDFVLRSPVRQVDNPTPDFDKAVTADNKLKLQIPVERREVSKARVTSSSDSSTASAGSASSQTQETRDLMNEMLTEVDAEDLPDLDQRMDADSDAQEVRVPETEEQTRRMEDRRDIPGGSEVRETREVRTERRTGTRRYQPEGEGAGPVNDPEEGLKQEEMEVLTGKEVGYGDVTPDKETETGGFQSAQVEGRQIVAGADQLEDQSLKGSVDKVIEEYIDADQLGSGPGALVPDQKNVPDPDEVAENADPDLTRPEDVDSDSSIDNVFEDRPQNSQSDKPDSDSEFEGVKSTRKDLDVGAAAATASGLAEENAAVNKLAQRQDQELELTPLQEQGQEEGQQQVQEQVETNIPDHIIDQEGGEPIRGPDELRRVPENRPEDRDRNRDRDNEEEEEEDFFPDPFKQTEDKKKEGQGTEAAPSLNAVLFDIEGDLQEDGSFTGLETRPTEEDVDPFK